MFVYQNDKLYVERDNKFVGVEIYPDQLIITDDETVLEDGLLLTPYEVKCKFGIMELNIVTPEHTTPEEPETPNEEGDTDDTVGEVEATPRRGRPRTR